MLHNMYRGSVQELAWWIQLAVAGLLAWLLVREHERVRRFVLVGAFLAAILQVVVGRSYWFHRYEVYAMIFTVLVAATALVEQIKQLDKPRLWRGLLAAGLLGVGAPYAMALWETLAAAGNVFEQQYQMHRFVADYYRRTVAVNDLGLVSYRRPAGVYVLDLFGLASPEAAHEKHKNAGWMDEITNRHRTGLAIIYPDWYEEGAPDDWKPLGTMCITGDLVSVSRRCVVFYSTAEGNTEELQRQMGEFTRTLPNSVKMTLGRDASGEKP